MQQLKEVILEKFSCTNAHCVFFSRIAPENNRCTKCISDDWDAIDEIESPLEELK